MEYRSFLMSFLTALICFLIFFTVPIGTFAEFNGWLTGIITDAVSKEPIANALIRTDMGYSNISSSNGAYWIIHEPETNIKVTVNASGYKEKMLEVSIIEGGTTMVNFELEPLLPQYHSADYNPPDYKISLSELLRIIQLYNSGYYHCNPDGEDGYATEKGDQTCTPHDADYNPHDWNISLSELLRLIQLYNASGYRADPGSEDGFAPEK